MQRPYISPQQEQELQHEYRHTYQRRLSPNPNYEFEGGINYRYVNQFTPSQSSLTPPMQSMQVYGVNPYPNQQHYENFYIGSDHGLGIQMVWIVHCDKICIRSKLIAISTGWIRYSWQCLLF